MRRLPLFCALFLLATVVNGQQRKPAIPTFGESIEVSVVNVDVIVTDREGNRVRGLTQNDFVIEEDGRPQSITHFAEYRDLDGTVGVDAADATESTAPEQRRTVVLFIEKFRLQNFRVDPFIASLKELLRSTIREGDAVTIVMYDGKPGTWLAPTDDLQLADSVLDQIRNELIGARSDRTTQVAQQAAEMRDFEREGAAMASGRGLRRAATSDAKIVADTARIYALEARLEMSRRVAAINTILHGLAGVEGKKMLVLATRRLGEFAGAEFYYAAGQQDARLPPGERDILDNRDRIRTIVENANAAGVTIYPVYPSGLDERPADPSSPDISRLVLLNEMTMLTHIAKETGGLSTYGTKMIVDLLPKVASDATEYYSLAYRATTSAEDTARKIVVRTKNRDLAVRSRNQFVYKSHDSKMRERLVAATYGLWEESPFRVNADLGAPKKAGRKQMRPLKVRIPIGELTLVPQGEKHAGAFSVYIVAAGGDREPSDITHQTQSFEVPAGEVERAMNSHFTYEFDLQMRADTEVVAVGVLDEVSKNYAVTEVRVD